MNETGMNFANIGNTVKAIREEKLWTQPTLAEAAGIDARTVQRLESGKSISKESLLAIAGALDVSAQALDVDLAALAAEIEETRKRYEPVTLELAVRASTIGGYLPCHAMHFEVCTLRTEDQEEARTMLESAMEDADLAWDIGAGARRASEMEIQDALDALAAADLAVTVGKHEVKLRRKDQPANTALTWNVLFLVISPSSAPRMAAAWDKKADIQFG